METSSLDGAAQTVIVAPGHELSPGFTVRRALPSRERRMVGPFVFFDHIGPAALEPGRGLDVRPHPHIGLATVTYLFEGELLHRDSLGHVQTIRPGAVNWMTAGRGIVHSERTPPALRGSGGRMSGLQIWVALPQKDEEREPDFVHHPADQLPEGDDEGRRLKVILGSVYGMRSPVVTCSEMFYVDARLDQGARLPMPSKQEERAFYVLSGEVTVEPDEGGVFREGQLVVLRPDADVTVRARTPARIMLAGGATLDGPRHIRWNFVSSSLERIQQASADWLEHRFPPVPEEKEFIPLPDHLKPVAWYP